MYRKTSFSVSKVRGFSEPEKQNKIEAEACFPSENS
jgi:hypothetical protein